MNRKKWLLTGAAVLLAALLLILIPVFAEGWKAESPDPDSRYPYTLLETGKGLLVTITGSEDGYQWNAAVDDPETAYAKVRSAKAKKTKILISPGEDGNAEAVFFQESAAGIYDCLYRISLRIRTEDGGMTVLYCAHTELPGTVLDEAGRYLLLFPADGSCVVCMADEAERDWAAELLDGSASVSRITADEAAGFGILREAADAQAREYFRIAGNGGTGAEIRIGDRKQGDSLLLTVSEDGDGMLRLSECAYHVGGEPEESAETGWALPESALLPEFGSADCFSQENGRAFTADTAVFLMKGCSWRLLRAEGVSRADLSIRDCRSADEADMEEVSPVWYYRTDGIWCAAWESAGRGYLLSALSETEKQTVEEAAAVLMEQRP